MRQVIMYSPKHPHLEYNCFNLTLQLLKREKRCSSTFCEMRQRSVTRGGVGTSVCEGVCHTSGNRSVCVSILLNQISCLNNQFLFCLKLNGIQNMSHLKDTGFKSTIYYILQQFQSRNSLLLLFCLKTNQQMLKVNQQLSTIK